MSVYVKQHSVVCCFDNSNAWVVLSSIEQNIKKKINSMGIALKDWNVRINYGIKTGCNEAFVVSAQKREEILSNCLSPEERAKTDELIRPILRGRDINRYNYKWANLYLIATFPAMQYDINDYPSLKQYLLSFAYEDLNDRGYNWIASQYLSEFCQQKLAQTGEKIIINNKIITFDNTIQKARKKTNNKWFETQDSISYWEDFFKPKIVYREIGTEMDASIVPEGWTINNKLYMVTGKHLYYIIAFLNSSIFNRIILQQANITGGKGEDFLANIKLIRPNVKIYKEIYKAILYKSQNWEKTIDKCFYELYSLSDSEIEFIDNIN